MVIDERGFPVVGATLAGQEKSVKTDINGQFYIPFLVNEIEVGVSAKDYYSSAVTNINGDAPVTVVLKKHSEGPVFKLQKLLYESFNI